MNITKTLPIALAALLLSQTHVAAQSYQNAITAESEVSQWPPVPFAGGANFTSIETADLDGDGANDYVVSDAGHLVFMTRPEDFSAFEELSQYDILGTVTGPLVVNDFGLLEASSTSGGLGGVAYVNALGLGIHQYDTGTQTFLYTHMSGVAWAGAKQISVCDYDSDGDQDILALDAAGTSVLVKLNGGAGVWTDGTTVSLPLAYDVLVPLDWTSSAGLEIAVQNAVGLIVVNSSGTVITVRNSAIGTDMLVRVEDNNVRDSLAWVAGPINAANDYYLVTLNRAIGTTDLTILPGPKQPLSLTGGDFDGDNVTDLAITRMLAQNVRVIHGDGLGYSAGSVTDLSAFSSMSIVGAMNTSTVCFADMDFDGLVDIGMPADHLKGIAILHQVFVPPPGSGNTPPPVDDFAEGQTEICLNAGQSGYLTAEFSYASLPDHFEVTTWRQLDGLDTVENISISTCPAPQITSVPGSPNVSMAFDVPAFALAEGAPGAPTAPNGNTLHFLLTPMDANNLISDRSLILSFSMDASNLGPNGSVDLSANWTDSEDVEVTFCGGGGPDGADGKGQSSGKVPPTSGGLPPRKNPACFQANNMPPT